MPKKLTTKEFVKKAKLIHKNKYDYSEVIYKNSQTKIDIKCLNHGVFKQTPNNHISQNQGCPICAGNKKNSINEFIQNSKNIHGNKYDYSLINYKNNKTKVKIICKKHGEFIQKPCDHINQKQGCPRCVGLGRPNKAFINDESEQHADKYNYSKVVYKKYNKHIDIICPIHGKFKQKPYIHLMGSGCQKCSESKGERKVALFLKKNNVNFERQKVFNDCRNFKTNRHLKFDFYLPDYNTCIEYDGEYHYEPWRLYFDKSVAKIKFEEMKQRDVLIKLFLIIYIKTINYGSRYLWVC